MSGQTRLVERFTAWCMCPHCKRIDCHSLRLPNPDASLTVDSGRETISIVDFGGRVVSKVEAGTEEFDESRFEVIRTCRCGYEWGQS